MLHNKYEYFLETQSFGFQSNASNPYDNFIQNNLKPFTEYYNDNEKILQYLSGSEDIKNILLKSGSFEILNFDKTSTGGFVNYNSLYNMDSLAFSGFLIE